MAPLNFGVKIRHLEKEAIACKRIESKLRSSEQRFKDIAENALEWIWEVDSEGRYIYSSPVVKQILGYDSKEIIGNYFTDRVSRSGYRCYSTV
jgi:PAS domain-containing protein